MSNHFHPAPPIVLTIAGFDPSGGAGTAADLKTLAALNCYGIAAVTALTIQSTQGVKAVHSTPAAALRAQIEALLEDSAIAAVKIGMLGNRGNAAAVADILEKSALPNVVLDPVIRSSVGDVELMDSSGVKYLREELLKRATLVTPNVPEAELLLGMEIRDVAAMEAAARALVERGASAALVKGGHLDKPVDVLFDGLEVVKYEGERVRSDNTHGSGCTLSSAIAAQLAHGKPLREAVLLAKVYVQKAMEHAYATGKGPGPLNHFFRTQVESATRGVHAEELHPVQVPPAER
ncbi:MAG TPA: bifunctional hydroxymethylpyrimidine kinase/phosphomethylpyrimidine kinase [Candidatus Acidoferrales bacterium]|nr:bifunctional hydroxymethylpyrimidine kinase/phosphomethylpyrimidine kinase [Candidatus Acidoferrales bacterium]